MDENKNWQENLRGMNIEVDFVTDRKIFIGIKHGEQDFISADLHDFCKTVFEAIQFHASKEKLKVQVLFEGNWCKKYVAQELNDRGRTWISSCGIPKQFDVIGIDARRQKILKEMGIDRFENELNGDVAQNFYRKYEQYASKVKSASQNANILVDLINQKNESNSFDDSCCTAEDVIVYLDDMTLFAQGMNHPEVDNDCLQIVIAGINHAPEFHDFSKIFLTSELRMLYENEINRRKLLNEFFEKDQR